MFKTFTDTLRLNSVLLLQKKALKACRAGSFDESYLRLKSMESIAEKITVESHKVDALIAIAALYQAAGVPERAMAIMHDLARYPSSSKPEIRMMSCVIVAQCAAMKETEPSDGYQELNDTLCMSVDEDPELKGDRFNGKKAELFGALSMGHVLRGDIEQGDILLRLALHYDPRHLADQRAWPHARADHRLAAWVDFLEAFQPVPGSAAEEVVHEEVRGMRREPELRQEPA